MLRNAFPDLHCIVEEEILAGDHAAIRWVMHGVQKGPYLGNPPTGRLIEIQGLTFAHMLNGRIIEDWTLIDEMGILQQLGVIPPSIRKER